MTAADANNAMTSAMQYIQQCGSKNNMEFYWEHDYKNCKKCLDCIATCKALKLSNLNRIIRDPKKCTKCETCSTLCNNIETEFYTKT